MKRVLVLNNYSFEDTWREVLRGEKPDHHLYGINHFQEQGYEVELVPFVHSKLLQSISDFSKKTVPVPLGNLDQEWSTIKRLPKADIVYAPCQTESHLLSYLRAIGIIRKPIVCIAHHPLNRGRLSHFRSPFVKLCVNGTDAFPALSSKLSDDINQTAGNSLKSTPLSWGPDLDYYPFELSLGRGVVAAGRTGRDFLTFGLAASKTTSPAQIVCLENSVSSDFRKFDKTVQVTIRSNNLPMQYPELLKIYSRARVIAIPMYAGTSLCGLTGLTDAMAMGKPVIMTRNELIDIDVEREGIGKWVEPADVEGWKQAIQFFEDHEDEAVEMGTRARALVSKFNSKNFAKQVTDIFDWVLT